MHGDGKASALKMTQRRPAFRDSKGIGLGLFTSYKSIRTCVYIYTYGSMICIYGYANIHEHICMYLFIYSLLGLLLRCTWPKLGVGRISLEKNDFPCRGTKRGYIMLVGE